MPSLFLRTGRSIVVVSILATAAHADDIAKRQIGQVVIEGVPEIDDGLRQRMMQYLEVRRAGVTDISADGKSLLVGTRFGTVNQIHLVTSPLGMRRQITFF